MHYHCEIVLPPEAKEDLPKAIESVMKDFKEGDVDEDNTPNAHGFWDWYVIGGRWAGHKQEALLGSDRIDKFMDLIIEKGFTVSCSRAGKQTLDPPSQIPAVDALWKEHFPDSPFDSCPLFSHSNDQYSEYLPGDVMLLSEVPEDLTAERVILAAPKKDWGSEGRPIIVGEFEATNMIEKSFWNGVTFNDTFWDGRFESAITYFKSKFESYKQEYRDSVTPTENWIAVTIDYHT